MRATGEGTGVALVASAASSVIGFVVLAFAPMPMFAAYGLLTAIMIVMAVTATLLVLPPLLRMASRDTPRSLDTGPVEVSTAS
jgi:predicted RND superfamily exporter protein